MTLYCLFCVALYLTDLLCVFQGDIIDNIEQNVSKSVDHIIAAKEQTKKAVRYQTKARKVMYFSHLPHQFACDLFLFFFSCLFSRYNKTFFTVWHIETTQCAYRSHSLALYTHWQSCTAVTFCVLRLSVSPSCFICLLLLLSVTSDTAHHIRAEWLTGLRATWTNRWALWSGP